MLARSLYRNQTLARTFSTFSKFQAFDPLNLNSKLTEEELLIQDAARKFAQEKLLPRVIEGTRKEYFDPEIMREMGEQGFLGAHLTEYDLPGVSSTAYGLISKEIERVDSGYRSAHSVQSSLVMLPIHEFANKEVKDEWIPKLATGEAIGAFGLTEPNHGSNPGGMETTAKDMGDHFLVNGSKTWITNSPLADVFVVWAKNDAKEIKGYVLSRDMGGIETPKIDGKMSLRASCTGMIMMDNVKVPKSHELNVTGLKGPFTCLNSARFGISWGVLGAAEHCMEVALDYTLERKQFNKPLAATQLVQTKLANMATEIALATHAVHQVSQLKDQGLVNPEMISMMKRNNVGKALDIARTARDMLGGNGIIDEYHVFRHLANLETVNTYEGTYDIHGLILGRAITGIQSFA